MPESFLRQGSELFDIKALEPIPGLASIISGKPALRFRADDVEIALEPEELYRLASHALRRNEYFALRDRFGLFHEDFYDPDSGVALQPMFEDEYEADQAVR